MLHEKGGKDVREGGRKICEGLRETLRSGSKTSEKKGKKEKEMELETCLCIRKAKNNQMPCS